MRIIQGTRCRYCNFLIVQDKNGVWIHADDGSPQCFFSEDSPNAIPKRETENG